MHLRKAACVSLGCLLSLSLGACATRGGSRSPFPSRAEVDALTHGSGAVNPFAQAVVDADTWRFEEPAAETLDHAEYVEPSPWGELLAEYAVLDPQRLKTTRAMHCAARELSRFYLEHAAMPSVPLRRAMLDHCGSLTDAVVPQFLFGAAAEEHTEAMLHDAWQSQVRSMLQTPGPPGARDLGIAFARDGTKAVVVFVSGARKVQLEPRPRVVGADGVAVLRGRVLVPADRILALINQGRFGYAICESDERVRLPDFAIRCALDTADRSARIELSARVEGRVLGDGLLGAEVLRDLSRSEYERQPYADSAIVEDPGELRSRLLALLNQVRGQAGAPPVALSDAESATSEKLAPVYFEALAEPARAPEADAITLGLLAGWDVGAPIRDAGFTAAAVGPTRDASEWLSAVLSSPGGRAALLDPDAQVVALGPVMVDSPAVIGAIFTSYTLIDSGDHEEVKRQVVEKIDAERSARGLPEATVVATLDGDAAALASEVNAGAITPTQALAELIQTSARVLGGPVRGLAFEATDLKLLELPEDLLRPKHLELSITVTHYQPEGEPWGRYVVLLVIPGEGIRA